MSRECVLITFEGIDGSGKSSASQKIKQLLQDNKYNVVMLREPGTTELGEMIREILMYNEMDEKTKLMLFLTSRADLVNKELEQYRDKKTVILCDRFIDSTMVYQAHIKGYDKELIDNVNKFIVGDFIPDLTLWFDIDSETALKRTHADATRELTLYDKQEKEYFEKLTEGYLEIYNNEKRVHRVDASKGKDHVVDDCMQKILELLNKKGWLLS